MPRYALVIDGVLQRLQVLPAQPANIAHKQVVWLPCPPVSPPSFDPATENLGPAEYAIGETEVTESWPVTNKTAQEISDYLDGRVNNLSGSDLKTVLTAVMNAERASRNPPANSWAESDFTDFAKALF